MKKHRVGIVGCGNIARTKHMPNLAKFPNRAEMTAFCDKDIDKARQAAEEYGTAEAHIYTDYLEMVNDSQIDVIHVCTPNRWHCPMTVAALEHGKHVMCEKPMAITAHEAGLMLEAARKADKLLTIGYQNRFRKDCLTLKKLIVEGEMGEVYFAKAHALRRRGIPNWGVFTNKEEQGGGPLIDIGTHALDITLWMMDNYEPVSVLGSTFNLLGTTLRGSEQGTDEHWDPDTFEVEDSAFGLIKFANGATVFLESSWALNTMQQKQAMTTLYATKAGASMEYIGGTSTGRKLLINKVSAGQPVIVEFDVKEKDASSADLIFNYPGAEKEMTSWLDALDGNGEVVVKPEQAFAVTQILEAIYRSARTGEVVYLNK
jgi:predicted dehydrogenase